MKSLVVVLCLAAIVSSLQAHSFDCRRVGWRSTSGRICAVAVSVSYTHVVHDAFGLRTIEVRDLQSPDEGVYSYAQDSARRAHVPGGGDYALEVSGALVGGVLVGVASAVAGAMVVSALWSFSSPSDDPYDPSPVAVPLFVGGVAGAAFGYPCGSAWGTTAVGSGLDWEGNSGLAYAGAYLGLPVGVGLACLGALAQGSALEIPLYAVGVLAPAIGAVIGYNTGVQRTSLWGSLGPRVALPTLALCTRQGPDRQRHSTFDCRLMTVRF